MTDDRDGGFGGYVSTARPESFRPHHDLEALRVPPQSVEAEQAVIGGLLLANEAFDRVADLLSEGDFYRRDHRLIYRGIVELADKHKPFDAVTLGEWFEANGLKEQIGGPGYLVMLASTTPSAANIRAYAEIVREKSVLRQLIEAGTEIVNDGFQPEGRAPIDLVGNAVTKISGLLSSEPGELEGLRPVMKEMFQELQERYERGGGITGLSTGFDELDRVLNGLNGGRFYVIASRPKMGKSTLAMNIAEHVAVELGKGVAFFTLEMPRNELAGRLTCSVGRIPHARFRTGDLADEDWAGVNAAIKRLAGAPIVLSRPRNTRGQSIVAQARRRHAKSPLGLIVIDYMQLVDTEGAENRQLGLSEVSRIFKMLAIDLNVPVMALSQLNRGVEARTNKRPTPADLRDTGALEQDADVVAFLYRDEVYDRHSRDKGTCEVDIALQRDGPSETIRLKTRLDICRFENLDPDWKPEPAPDGDRPTRRGGFKKSKAGDGRERAAGDDA